MMTTTDGRYDGTRSALQTSQVVYKNYSSRVRYEMIQCMPPKKCHGRIGLVGVLPKSWRSPLIHYDETAV